VDPFATTRARIGIEPDGFAWTLAPGEELTTPEAVIAYAADGLDELSDAFHRVFRERLAREADAREAGVDDRDDGRRRRHGSGVSRRVP
jgi:alpha-galactosidase